MATAVTPVRRAQCRYLIRRDRVLIGIAQLYAHIIGHSRDLRITHFIREIGHALIAVQDHARDEMFGIHLGIACQRRIGPRP